MWIYPLLATFTLAALLYAERHHAPFGRTVFKTLTSLLFVIAAWTAGPAGGYGGYLFAGLLLSFVGDLLLIPRAKPYFVASIGAFLLAHLLYFLAFTTLAPPSLASLPFLAGVAVMAAGFLYRFWGHLGSLRPAVVAYVLVITLMLFSAWSVLPSPEVPAITKVLIAIGAGLFYLSDLFVALERFVARRFINKLLGLPMYYTAQFMLAFSLTTVSA